ncbi:Galactan beta-1,4-galactosyltransferase GALS2, partial [Mucuna pruriens]
MAKEREKKLYVAVLGNYAAELKLLLTTLILLCAVATLLQFLPSRFTISASDLRVCFSSVTQTAPTISNATATNATSASPLAVSLSYTPALSPPPPPPLPPPSEQVLPGGIIKRAFNPYGSAAYNFITMGAYRGGLNTFAIIGLSSKPLHVYGKPTYECAWLSNAGEEASSAIGYKMLPDWGYGRVYTVVIVNCTFPGPLNADNSGGKLLLRASTSGGADATLNVTDTMEVLTESPGTLDTAVFSSKPKYDYFYCGSPLFKNLNPQRVREWIAYHVKFFGPRAHFVIHDAGGVHAQVVEVLKPWMDLGYVTLQDIRDQNRFDGYYRNQFMVLNDCLHRYKFMAKWMFFFDLDEYIYVPPNTTIKSVLDSLSEYSQFTIKQMRMSTDLCLTDDYGKTYRKWGFEKLVYKDSKKGIRRDRKYAAQPRSLFANGVHISDYFEGKTTHKTEGKIVYYHYRGIIVQRTESCKMFINSTEITYDKTPYVLDTTMRDIAGVIKEFELKMIGNRLQKTRQ